MKDPGKVKTTIGWQITRDPASSTMKIDQSAFIRDLVMDEDLSDYNANVVPIKAGSAIDMSDVDAYEQENLHTYQRLIGKLMYLACGTRPDIAFAVGQLSKHNSDPQRGHLRAAKRVVRYLKGTINVWTINQSSSPIRPDRLRRQQLCRRPRGSKAGNGLLLLSQWSSSIVEKQKAAIRLHVNHRSRIYSLRAWGKRGRMDQEIRQ